MKRLLGSFLPLAVALAAAAENSTSRPGITVLVYNYAAVPENTLVRAKAEGARIYHQAGIETAWLDCPLSPAQASAYPACQIDLGPTTLAIRIVPAPKATGLHLDADSYGFAQLPEDGGFGFAASVFAHRAETLANGNRSFLAVLLGHLIAHEIGHLLLGVGSHAPSGLMRVPWKAKELEFVRQGSLLFTSRQAESIRAQAQARAAVTGSR
jgi:hypothetical protein